MYVPPEGKLIRDIESSWVLLEKAEHDRELALREELVRFVSQKLLRLYLLFYVNLSNTFIDQLQWHLVGEQSFRRRQQRLPKCHLTS